MDGHRFDHLTRRVGSRLSRRAGLGLLAVVGVIGRDSSSSIAGKKKKKKGKKKEKIAICHQGQTLKVKKKGWQGRFPGATQGSCQVSSDVCAGCLNTCFATVKNSAEAPPEGYACCPADKVCLTPRTDGFFPDQCCYPDEVCDPDRVNPASPRFAIDADSLCCRRCVANTTCCPYGFFCAATDTCEPLGTARLPRSRRP